MAAKNKILICFLFAYLSMPLLYAEANQARRVVSITGGQFKACIVTFPDFEKMVASAYKGESELDIFLSKIENYTIDVTQDGVTYFVAYTPKKLKNTISFGGGARYDVSIDSFEILKKKYYE